MIVSLEKYQEEIDSIKSDNGLKSMRYDGIVTSPTNEISSSTETLALRNIEKVKDLQAKMLKLKILIERVDKSLMHLDDTKRTIIVERYINGLKWNQIAEKLFYSVRWCKELRKDALREIVIIMHENK